MTKRNVLRMRSGCVRRFRQVWLAPLTAIGFLLGSGCGSPSLLVTPVTGRRALVETELSRDGLFAFDKIALIDVSGILLNAPKRQLLSEGEHPVSLLLEQLDKARRDRHVKAVILRINSPGGAVVASELMHDELRRFRKSGKPVIAVLMDVAASGGYYIACACDEIVAMPSTITGSIGVLMQMFDVSGTMKIVGIQSDAIISGPYKDAGSPLRPMREEERKLFEQIVHEMYERFIAVVAKGRRLDQADVRKLADGRVFTATQALEAGLIDRIMSMHDAIGLAKDRANSKRIRLVAYHRSFVYRPNYYAQYPYSPGTDINLFNLELPNVLGRTTPQFMYLWTPARQ